MGCGMIGVALVVVVLSLIFFSTLRRGKTESYSLDHAILNIPSPQTLWMNMGYWKVADYYNSLTYEQDKKSFQEACEALFHLLVARAEILPNLDILDLGCGCGDSTGLLAEFKPHTLRGVSSETAQSQLSQQRFPHIKFIHSDAVEYITSLPNKSLDRIFALDCAYHFPSRKNFLYQSCRVLRRDGRIAMTDLIFGDNISPLQRALTWVICLLTNAPYSNFKTEMEYYSDFLHAGYNDATIEDISRDVFPGLQEFISRHRKEMSRFGISGNWTGYLVFSRVLKWWSETGVVRFIVVHAQKSSSPLDERI
jgi:SAM-dependent methyltransferase